jgi:HSP20 family protein
MSYRRDPFRELWNEVGRISEEFQRAFGQRTSHSAGIHVWSDEQNVYAETDLPGVDPKNIEVTLNNGKTLVVQASRELPSQESSEWVRQERPAGVVTREVELPVAVDANKIEAKSEFGVLKLTMPKSEAAQPRKIVVN